MTFRVVVAGQWLRPPMAGGMPPRSGGPTGGPPGGMPHGMFPPRGPPPRGMMPPGGPPAMRPPPFQGLNFLNVFSHGKKLN